MLAPRLSRWIPAPLGLLAVGCALASCAAPAGAAELAGTLGPVSYRAIAPDWVWLGDRMNVLVILETERTLHVGLELEYPETAFTAEESTSPWRVVEPVASGRTSRFAFRGLQPRLSGPAVHELVLRLSVAAGSGPALERELRLEVTTVRGSAVPEGPWSVIVPTCIACLSVPAFLFLLWRHGARGGWRAPSDPPIPECERAWWKETT